jgi:hypothetical protein
MAQHNATPVMEQFMSVVHEAQVFVETLQRELLGDDIKAPCSEEDMSRRHSIATEVARRLMASSPGRKLALLFHPDATFNSPVVHSDYAGRDVIGMILCHVVQVLEKLTYTRKYVRVDGSGFALFFQAQVRSEKRLLQVEGVDFVELHENGTQIKNLTVMVRPLRPYLKLADTMRKRVMAAMKSKL